MEKEYTILIIDDETKNIDILYHTLKNKYVLKVAKNGKKGVEIALNYKVDLIVLDIFMPEFSGFEVMALLIKDEKTKNIPVIVMADIDSLVYIEKALQNGAIDYLIKPINSIIADVRINTQMEMIKRKV